MLANGLTIATSYDADTLRPKTITTGTVQNISYPYDKVGNIKTISDAVRNGLMLGKTCGVPLMLCRTLLP